MRVGYELANNSLISNKREWNNCFIENAHKIWRILPNCICKSNRFVSKRLLKKTTTKNKTNTNHNKRKQKPTDFQLVFNFEQTRTVTVFGEHGIINNYSSSLNGL